MKKNVELILIIILIGLESMILFNSKILFSSVSASIVLWKNNIFPTMFTFLMIGEILLSLNISKYIHKIIKLDYNLLSIIVLSIFSGTPSNAKFTIKLLKEKKITDKDATKILSFSHFMNPIFIIGSIGGIFLNDIKLSIIILISHYLPNLIFIFFTPNKKTEYVDDKEKVHFNNILSNSIKNSMHTCLIVLGTVVFYSIINSYIKDINFLPTSFKLVINSILEVTQGIKLISHIKLSGIIKSTIISMLLSFGGICIHTQVLGIISDSNIKYKNFFITRIIHSIISGIFCLLLNYLIY